MALQYLPLSFQFSFSFSEQLVVNGLYLLKLVKRNSLFFSADNTVLFSVVLIRRFGFCHASSGKEKSVEKLVVLFYLIQSQYLKSQ